MRKLILAGAVAAALATAGVASAGPLAPSLAIDPITGAFTGPDAQLCGTFSCIAGEGAAPNFQRGETVDTVFIGPGAVQHMDWIVIHDPLGTLVPASGGTALAIDDNYLFLYQLENSSIFELTTMTIGGFSNPPKTFGFKSGTSGFLSGKDLDLNGDTPGGEGHRGDLASDGGGAANFANLGDPDLAHSPFAAVNETEKTGAGATLSGIVDPATVFVTSLVANFGPITLKVGEESSIIFVRGTLPKYGNWLTGGVGDAGSPVAWGSANQSECSKTASDANGGTCPAAFVGDELGVMVPIPSIPEPTSLLLLGAGLGGLGFWARRRRKS